MSSSIDTRERPGAWYKFNNFGFKSSTPRRRASSAASRLPHTNYSPLASNGSRTDPFEKPARHSSSPSSSFMTEARTAWMNQGQRARYVKAGGLLAFILLIFYFLTPSTIETPFHKGAGYGPSAQDEGASTGTSGAKCTKPYHSHKPLTQYALMIDAGSTGSRIHVYRFNNCGPTPELEDEVFQMTPKKEGGSGLSSYGADAEGAAQSLDVLMDVAVANVPKEDQSCTPVAVKATAGLRKLGPDLSQKILDAVRHRLETVYPFPVITEEKHGVEVMEGTDEGVYAWITTNYLLGKIGGPDKTPTAAVFDLGGGSTQIVFQPTFPMRDGGMPEKMQEGDHKYELSFGGRDFELYQHSYLGYGLMEARRNLHRLILTNTYDLHKSSPSSSANWLSQPIINPCIIPGQSREVEVDLPEDHPLGPVQTVNMTGPATPSPAQCRALAEKTLKKDLECTVAPCAFNGVHQPSLAKTFAREDIYLFSYFYDRTQPLGMPESFTIHELQDLTAKVCHGNTDGAWEGFEAVEGAMAELVGRPEYCLDLSFMVALLHTGYEMPIDREVRIAKKIKGNELGWCLGASLPLLEKESGWQCRIREVS